MTFAAKKKYDFLEVLCTYSIGITMTMTWYVPMVFLPEQQKKHVATTADLNSLVERPFERELNSQRRIWLTTTIEAIFRRPHDIVNQQILPKV